MAESQLWSLLKSKIGQYGHLVRIENLTELGTPDVEGSIGGVGFWIELKEIAGWPVKPETPVRIPHYRKEQRLWIRARTRAGGRVFLLLRVGKHPRARYLLFSGAFAWEHVGKVPRSELEAGAIWSGDRIEEADVVACLTGNPSSSR